MPSAQSRGTTLLLIGIFKLIKATLLLAAAIGALKLLHQDVAGLAAGWVDALSVDPDNRYIHRVLTRLASVDDRKLKEISAGTFFYAGVFLTEGIGLVLRKTWAEYFTIIVTASFIPFEVYELAKHFSPVKALLILLNGAILGYLIVHRMAERKRETMSLNTRS